MSSRVARCGSCTPSEARASSTCSLAHVSNLLHREPAGLACVDVLIPVTQNIPWALAYRCMHVMMTVAHACNRRSATSTSTQAAPALHTSPSHTQPQQVAQGTLSPLFYVAAAGVGRVGAGGPQKRASTASIW
jgi:hypothetical protein